MYIAVDIGGTTTRVASFESPSTPHIVSRQNFPTHPNYQEGLKQIIETMRALSGENIDAVGVCIASPLDENKTHLKTPPNLHGWIDKPFKADLEKALRCAVLLENDAASSALAEATYANSAKSNFLFVIWGTGIGGVFVNYNNGKPEVVASELGHINIVPDGLLCGCGKKGCIEAYCGGGNIKKYYGKPPQELSHEEWKEVEAHFTNGLTTMLIQHPADTVVFSGGIALDQRARIKTIEAIVRNKLKDKNIQPTFSVSDLGDDSGLFGALSLLK